MERISAWNLTNVRSKKEVIDEARTSGAKVHFASLMDICHLNKAEKEAKHQKYKGSSCTPRRKGKTIQDQRSFHRARIFSISKDSRQKQEIISRLPGCDGQAADAEPAYTQVKMEDSHKFIENSKIVVSRHLDSSTTTQMAKIMVQYGRSSRSS